MMDDGPAARDRCTSNGLAYSSPNDVDRREEADPDHVHEVPVDGRGLHCEMASRGELTLERAVEDDRVEDHAAGHMRSMEPGQREEDAGEDPVARQESKPRVLVT